MKLPRINGPRGVMMLGFSFVAMAFGLAYVGPLAVGGTPGPLQLLALILPIHAWGAIWLSTAVALIWSAFRLDQSLPLGIFTGLMFMWTVLYLISTIQQIVDTGHSWQWINALIFGGVTLACRGATRLVNPQPPPERPPGLLRKGK